MFNFRKGLTSLVEVLPFVCEYPLAAVSHQKLFMVKDQLIIHKAIVYTTGLPISINEKLIYVDQLPRCSQNYSTISATLKNNLGCRKENFLKNLPELQSYTTQSSSIHRVALKNIGKMLQE